MYSQCRVLAVDQSSLKFLYIDQGDPHRPFVDMRMALQAYSITLLGVSPGSSCNVLLPTTILVHQHLVKCLFETCKLTTYRSHLKLLLTHWPAFPSWSRYALVAAFRCQSSFVMIRMCWRPYLSLWGWLVCEVLTSTKLVLRKAWVLTGTLSQTILWFPCDRSLVRWRNVVYFLCYARFTII